jgi:tetratricopeptide (TPR) repeat protein
MQKVSSKGNANVVAGNQVINIIADSKTQPVVPSQLLRDDLAFTGREHEMENLTNLVSGSVLVTAIDGIAGVGKTALAVHAAHRLRPQFPDGQLYYDLRGYTSGEPPTDPSKVLEYFLESLGVPPDNIPSDVESRSGMLRGELASRRVLMLLDNAASEDQIKHLMPGAGGSLVIITSRSTLPGLVADNRISLDVLRVGESTTLLTRVIGDERALAEPDAIQQVRKCCGDLPLALRIAAHILTLHPTWPISKLARLLADERDRLDQLAVGDHLDVRVAFEVSYRHLRGREKRTFRLLGLHPGANFDLVSAVQLVGVGVSAKVMQQTFDRLLEASLISEIGPGLFGLHDLLRLFAYEICLTKETKATRDAAQLHLIHYFTTIALMIGTRFGAGSQPGIAIRFDDIIYDATSGAKAWELFDLNRAGMLGALKVAVEQGWAEEAWKLFEPMVPVLLLARRIDDLVDASQGVILVARQVGNLTIEQDALEALGSAYNELGWHEDAIDCYETALAALRREADRKGECRVLTNIGNALADSSRFDDAIVSYREALAISMTIGSQRAQAQVLAGLGATSLRMRRFDQAIQTFRDALQIFEERHDRRDCGITLLNLGAAHGELGQFDQSIEFYLAAIDSLGEAGDRHSEGAALLNLAVTYRQLVRVNDAIEVYLTALDLFRSSNDRLNEGEVLASLGDTVYGLRQNERASQYWLEAAKIAQELGNEREVARLRTLVSRAESPWRRLWRR